jgi:tetratricopeptide (TPR) repeat protein
MPRLFRAPTAHNVTSSPHSVFRWIASAALALAALAPAGVAQGRIDVLNNSGEVTPIAGTTVTSETLDEVRYTRSGSKRTENRPANRVVHIEYGKGSAAYEGALDALASGDLQNAVNLFSAAVNDKTPAWVPAHALLGLADARNQGGDTAEARAAVQRFLDEHANHRLTPRALLLSARFASAASDDGRAQSDIDQVLSLVSSNKITVDWAARAHLERGQNLLDAGNFSDARTAFTAAEVAARDGAKDPGDRDDLVPELTRLGLEARSGSGSALLASGDLAAARTFFDTLQRDGQDDPAIRAAALNGKAEADFLDDGRMKEAQIGFARVAVIGAGVPNQHAKALYYSGRCSEALGEEGAEPNGRARAHQYYKDVEQRYPGSRWARLARESLP